MAIDPIVLSTLTGAVSVVANEYFKGIATDAGKTTWSGIKSLLGWTSDPAPAEIPNRVAQAIAASPETTERLLKLLKGDQASRGAALVGELKVSGGKVVVAGSVGKVNM